MGVEMYMATQVDGTEVEHTFYELGGDWGI